MKRVFALLLALMLVMSLATTAFAADTSKLTIDTAGYSARVFDAYMVLSATNDGVNYNYEVVSEYRDVLIDVLDVVTTDKTEVQIDIDIVTAIGNLATGEDVLHFADDLYRAILAADPAIAPIINNWDGAERVVDQGYWLVADVTDLEGDDETNSLVILDTAGDADVKVALKADVTTGVKKVDDENDSIIGEIAGNEDGRNWQDTADYDIGDVVPFRVTGQLTNDVTSYTYYSFKIVDTVSEGLTHLDNSNPDENHIQLLLNGEVQTLKAAGETGEADWIYEIEGRTLTIYPNYGYTRNDGTVVEASAENGGDLLKLFPENTPHDEINNSTYTLGYHCLLNEDAVPGNAGNRNDVKVVISNNPYGDGFGETPLDTTITFTYNFVVNKVDPEGNPLTGAQFGLYKFVAEGQGKYPGAEPVANTAEEAIKGNKYFNHPSANGYGKFVEVDRVTVNAEGTEFTFKGIDDGYYTLLETVVPDGYKAIEPVEFQVIATHVSDLSGNPVNKLTDLHAVVKGGINQRIDGDEATGTLTAVIENHTGSELPSTGGMGTTLFYIFGGLMTVAALVLLVTKKRMSVN